MEGILAIFAVILVIVIENVAGSTGDRSQMFYSCLQNCLAENCTGIFIIITCLKLFIIGLIFISVTSSFPPSSTFKVTTVGVP